ncbi:ATP-binding SpoIIE family protein phosphatase [Streptomyces viridochromogenes]|uniref:ATP-binding SpoIIE family protein phosphatase n=1 Tax=Streptomyces viridochromogenes TaxID=1938 RepID=UPI003CC7E943
MVGDVVGHCIQASARMGRLCTAVRTLADVDLAPDELLTQLDDLVLRMDDKEVSEANSRPKAPRVRWGHMSVRGVRPDLPALFHGPSRPAPALITPDSTVDFLDPPAGPPLGLGGLPSEVADFELPRGSVLTLYTDGLIERPDPDMDAAHPALGDVLAAPARPPWTRRATGPCMPCSLNVDPTVPPCYRPGRRRWAPIRSIPGSRPPTPRLSLMRVSCPSRAWPTGTLRKSPSPRSSSSASWSPTPSATDTLLGAHLRDEGGRGLLILAQLAHRWGSRYPRNGKTIWAEVKLSQGQAFR